MDGSNTIMIWTDRGGSISVAYPYSLDTWHYITAVGTGSNLLLYFDGVQVASGGTSTNNYGVSTYPVKIGEGSSGLQADFSMVLWMKFVSLIFREALIG